MGQCHGCPCSLLFQDCSWRTPRNRQDETTPQNKSVVARNWPWRQQPCKPGYPMPGTSSHDNHAFWAWKSIHQISKLTTAKTLIHRLQKIFACYGFLDEITSNNGPQFVLDTFKGHLRENNIRHRKVTPYWLQANAEVERSNRTLEKALQVTYIEKKDWRGKIYTFLQNYRVKPHTLTSCGPCRTNV